MENSLASIRLRLPVPMGVTLGISLAIMFGYIVTIGLAFVFQDRIASITGINPAQISIVVLMIVLFIPWGVIAWLILNKFSKIGTLSLYSEHLIITDANNRVLKNYPSSALAEIKVQNNAFHFKFQDGYQFNIINMAMGNNYPQEMAAFNPYLLNFIKNNNISLQKGRII